MTPLFIRTWPTLLACATMLTAAAGLDAAPVAAGLVVRVPQDQPNVQAGLSAVPDGGVLELSGGTYTAPAGGFTIYPDLQGQTKSFTVRAATGQAVTLSGGSANPVLKFTTPKLVTFENIRFANGLSRDNFTGGGVTLVNGSQAFFNGCVFDSNAANPPTTGGGGLWIFGASAAFRDCTFTNNTSANYGGAMSIAEGEVYIGNTRFTRNRVTATAGGAIFDNNAKLVIANCTFEANQAGWVGGAIDTHGNWKGAVDVPIVDLTVTNTLFSGNSVGGTQEPAQGGAVHIEDQTTGRFLNCRFLDNTAQQGGAISSYRGITEVNGCVFRNNRAVGSGPGQSTGGSIFNFSADNADASTDFGRTNRRSAVLNVTDSYFEGDPAGGAVGSQGGAIFTSGDLNSGYGLGSVQQSGTPESNRATVNLTRVGFYNVKVQDGAGVLGKGAAVMGDFSVVNADRVIVRGCTASSDAAGFEMLRSSTLNLTNSTLAQNRADGTGAAITMFGGNLNLTSCNIIENGLTGGGRGAAITTVPQSAFGGAPAADVTGLVKDCTFTNNTAGSAIYDGDNASGPTHNEMQYSGNKFFGPAYVSDLFAAVDGAGLNAAIVTRRDASTTLKLPTGSAPNVTLTTAPTAGALLMLPPTVAQYGGPGETSMPSYACFAASGASATLTGPDRLSTTGVPSTTTDGVYTLTVGTASFSTTARPAAALNIATRLPVRSASDPLIGGFIITGNGPKRVLIRAVGPSLAAAGIATPLSDPLLELHDDTGAIIATNDNWKATQIGGAISGNQVLEIAGTGVAPTDDREASIIVTVNPNTPYTAVVSGYAGATGTAVVELYDLDAIQNSTLANISTRGFVQTSNDVMIGGFILGGGVGQTNVVIRAIGPSLQASGVDNFLADPTLDLVNSQGTVVESNDDWANGANAANIERAGLQPSAATESAIYRSDLPRDAYTAVVRGVNAATGTALVEVYVF